MNPRVLSDIEKVKDELDLKVKVAIAANDFILYQKYYNMREGLSWVLGYSNTDLDDLLKAILEAQE